MIWITPRGSPTKAPGRLNRPRSDPSRPWDQPVRRREDGANPAECIVIEDSPFGIQGAVGAGMTAIGYTGGGHTYAEHAARLTAAGADFVCADWQEVSRQLVEIGVLA